jgi:hypothetical protein
LLQWVPGLVAFRVFPRALLVHCPKGGTHLLSLVLWGNCRLRMLKFPGQLPPLALLPHVPCIERCAEICMTSMARKELIVVSHANAFLTLCPAFLRASPCPPLFSHLAPSR